MDSTGPLEAVSRSKRGILALVTVVAFATATAIGLYAAGGTGSNTLVIVPLVTGVGTGSGGVAVTVTDVGEDFSTHRRRHDEVKGRVLSRLDMGVSRAKANLVLNLLWTNSIDVTGPLSKDEALMRVGLFFLDSHQQRAKDKGYVGDCDELVQREFKLDNVKTYLCPDLSPGAHQTMSKFVAYGLISSTVNGHRLLYVLADIPKPPRKNETLDTSGSEDVGQIKKQEFQVLLYSI